MGVHRVFLITCGEKLRVSATSGRILSGSAFIHARVSGLRGNRQSRIKKRLLAGKAQNLISAQGQELSCKAIAFFRILRSCRLDDLLGAGKAAFLKFLRLVRAADRFWRMRIYISVETMNRLSSEGAGNRPCPVVLDPSPCHGSCLPAHSRCRRGNGRGTKMHIAGSGSSVLEDYGRL